VIDLWIPPKPAIIRPAEPSFVKASFLPGMFPGFIASAADALTLEFVTSTNSEATTITAPATVNAGDLLVLFDLALGILIPTAVTPTGFTNVANFASSSALRGMVSYKIAVGTEDGATITGMDGQSNERKQLLQFRGSSPIATVTPSTFNGQGTTGNPTAQNVVASGGTAPLIVVAMYGSQSPIDPRTFSPAADAEISTNVNLYVKYRIDALTGLDTSVDMDDEGNQALISGFLACA